MSSERLYASIDGRVSPLANQEVVFYDPARDQTHPMTTQVLQAMDLCRPFRTLDQHVAALASGLQGLAGREDAVRRVLESLVARGLMVSDEAWIEQLARPGQRAAASFAGVFIRAGARPPAYLARLLDSLLAYERAFAPGFRYVVIDATSDAAGASERRILVQDFASAAEVRASYLGGETLGSMGEALANPVGTAVARSLVHARGAGDGSSVARNIASLLAAGRRFVLVDEDQVFRVHAHGAVAQGLDLSGRAATVTKVCGSLDEALDWGEPIDDDPLALSLRVCGASLGDVVNRVPGFELGREHLPGLEPSRLAHVRSEAPLVAIAMGTRGLRPPGPWMFCQLDSEARAAWSSDRDSYLRWLQQPLLGSAASRVRLRVPGSGESLVLDASQPLPCALPSGEAGDAVFAALWQAMAPQALAVELPQSLGRESEAGSGDWLKRPLTRSGNAFVADFCGRAAAAVRGRQALDRLHTLAASLRDLAAASDGELRMELREYHAFARSQLVQSMQHAYESAGSSAAVHWQADVRQVVETQGRALIEAGEPRLGDSPAGLSAEAGLRDILSRSADALDAWPHLWAGALDATSSLWKRL